MSPCYCQRAKVAFIFQEKIYEKRIKNAPTKFEAIVFLYAYFISSKVAKYFAFKVVQLTDRGIVIVLMIQVFTVISQVALASILGVYHGYGFDSQFIPLYLITYCRNFMMALPVQLFIVGPMARYLFRVLFSSTNGVEEEKIEKELLEEGFAEQ